MELVTRDSSSVYALTKACPTTVQIAGYDIRSSFETVKELCPYSDVREGFSTKGGIERDGAFFVIKGEKATSAQTKVRKWLQKIKML